MIHIAEFILEILAEFLIGAPGAFVLWASKGFKGPYTETWTDNPNKSVFIGIVLWITVIAIIVASLNIIEQNQ